MNIFQLALRRIAVRATEKQILNAAKYFSTSEKIPSNYVPRIPSIKSVVIAFFTSFLAVIGAMVFIGLISIFSFKFAAIVGVVVAILFIINGAIIKSTSDKKTISVHVEDRRYNTGYREAGFLDIEDNENQISFTDVQRVYFFLENLFLALAIMAACYLVYLISELTKTDLFSVKIYLTSQTMLYKKTPR